MTQKTRYSDAELDLFKILITQKLEKATADLEFLQEQIADLSESMARETDWMDETSRNTDMEMLTTMAHRHKHHIRDLENALLRIKNKSYGICVITGELIDKRRLMAVPTTTKSLAAKNAAIEKEEDAKRKLVRNKQINHQGEIISKVIRKPSAAIPVDAVKMSDDDFFDDDDENYDVDSTSDNGQVEIVEYVEG